MNFRILIKMITLMKVTLLTILTALIITLIILLTVTIMLIIDMSNWWRVALHTKLS